MYYDKKNLTKRIQYSKAVNAVSNEVKPVSLLEESKFVILFSPEQIVAGMVDFKSENVKVLVNDVVSVSSNFDESSFIYVPSKEFFQLKDFNLVDKFVSFFEVEGDNNITAIAYYFLDAEQVKISAQVIKTNCSVETVLPIGCTSIRLGLRVGWKRSRINQITKI